MIVILGVERAIGRRGLQLIEPIRLPREVANETVRLRVVEHPVHLSREDLGVGQAALAGQFEQLGVRHAAPEKIGEPGGQREVVERAVLSAVEEKRRCAQDGTKRYANCLDERPAGLEQRAREIGIRGDFGIVHWAAECARREGRDDVDDVRIWILRQLDLTVGFGQSIIGIQKGDTGQELPGAPRRPGLEKRPFNDHRPEREPLAFVVPDVLVRLEVAASAVVGWLLGIGQ